jgi:hypothetical protein
MQTYDDDGATIPLPLDTPLPGPSRSQVREIREREKARDRAAERTRKRHHNPAGGAPLVILLPLKLHQRDSEDASLELPEGSKCLRKPVQNRAMPVPLSDKSRKLSAVDAKAVKDDADLLKRLQASIHGTDTSKKRKAADENTAPPPKKKVSDTSLFNSVLKRSQRRRN